MPRGRGTETKSNVFEDNNIVKEALKATLLEPKKKIRIKSTSKRKASATASECTCCNQADKQPPAADKQPSAADKQPSAADKQPSAKKRHSKSSSLNPIIIANTINDTASCNSTEDQLLTVNDTDDIVHPVTSGLDPGRISQEVDIKMVKVKVGDDPIKSIKIKDSTGECEVTLRKNLASVYPGLVST
ncbi:hypothetical protein ACF0H5_013127 [Mactra antiquata]